ncbi:MAG: hypothetical protein R2816_01380 [Flavobacteriaceae bacterium]|nr:O-antigen ligase family protein [Flavobacteriaceae bacterium]
MKELVLKKQYLLFLFLICISFLGDILRRFSFYMNFEFTRYTTVSKVVFIIVGLIYLGINFKQYSKNKKVNKIFLSVLILVFIFLVSRLFITSYLDYQSILNNAEYLAKYLFLPFLIILFIDLKESKKHIKLLIKAFEIIFFANILAIIAGLVFEIDVFKTYYYGDRFGYKGIYSMSGQTSIYFILMIYYYMHKLIFKINDKWDLTKCIITIAVSFCLGTKRIYFILPVLAMYFFFFLKGNNNLKTIKTGLLFGGLFLFFREQIIEITIKNKLLFQEIYNERGLLSSFTSYRSDLLKNIIEDKSFSNWIYLVGGQDFSKTRSEMGFFDLWLFFGFVGMIVYLGFYKALITFKRKHHFYWFCLITLIIIVFFADAFILDTNVPILLFLICSHINIYEKNRETIKSTVQA